MRVIAHAVAGTCAGAVLGVVVPGLLGGLVAIPQVDWRHSDAITDLAASTLMFGLIFGVFLGGALVGAVIGLVAGVILGLRSPVSPDATLRSLDPGPAGEAGKPARPFDDDFGTIGELPEKAPARPRKTRPPFWARLGVVILALFVILNLFWEYQRRYERHEIQLRLQQIASGDADVRRQALDAIRGLGPYAAPSVVEALGSQDVNMRRAALLASRTVLGTCLSKLDEMNCITGFVPGRGAASSGFEQLTAALNHSLEDENQALRLEAGRVLRSIADRQSQGAAGSEAPE
jgi:hypothetical protein